MMFEGIHPKPYFLEEEKIKRSFEVFKNFKEGKNSYNQNYGQTITI